MDLLIKIQQELNVPKNQFNEFGGYNYRSCEDILTAVKPFLEGATLILSDEVVEVGGRVYVKATATLNGELSATAYAREADTKKGMDAAQITGAASSYARKYALCGLFAIDDGNDPDKTNKHDKEPEKPEQTKELYAIDGIEKKTGTNETTGRPWTMFVITSGDKKFRTFDSGIADTAQSAYNSGLKCLIEAEKGKYGYEVIDLEPDLG